MNRTVFRIAAFVHRGGIFFFTLLVLCRPAVNGQSTERPAGTACLAVVGPREQFMGKVLQRRTLEYTVTLENECSDTVEIASVSSSCGCTVAVVSRNILPPRQQASVLLRFTPLKGQMGLVAKTVSVYLRGSDSPDLMFRVSAEVRSELALLEKRMRFDSLIAGKEAIQTMKIQNIASDELTVSSATEGMTLYPSDTAGAQASAIHFAGATIAPQEFQLPPEESKAVEIRLLAKQPGRIHGAIRFSTQHSDVYLDIEGTVYPRPTESHKRQRNRTRNK